MTKILLHWNGKAWSKVLVPKVVNLNGLAGLASDGPGGLNGSMKLIPGTRSVLAPAFGSGGGGAILKYGP